tara:strand:- start:110 stop:337 length:228 start_codon:yes stop_codon:yes gene_type:complete
MTKLFLLIIIMDLNMSMRHTIMEVPACPSKEEISKDFDAQQESGEILSWSGMCIPLEFNFEAPEKKEIKKEELDA